MSWLSYGLPKCADGDAHMAVEDDESYQTWRDNEIEDVKMQRLLPARVAAAACTVAAMNGSGTASGWTSQ